MNKSHYYRVKHKVQNWFFDTLAVVSGYCNRRSRIDDVGGGYSHWRCGLRRDHYGLHRFNNYVWSDDGVCDYMPIPSEMKISRQPNSWRRKP